MKLLIIKSDSIPKNIIPILTSFLVILFFSTGCKPVEEKLVIEYLEGDSLVQVKVMKAFKLLLKDDNLIVRVNAAEAMGRIGDVRTINLINCAFEDEYLSVRDISVESLIKIGTGAVKELINALKDDNFGVRMSSIEALGEIGDTLAVEPLIYALKDDNPNIRELAIVSLGRIGDARAIEPLIYTFKDKNQFIPRFSMESLINIGAGAVEPLIYALNDSSTKVRIYSAYTLGNLGDEKAIPILVYSLQDWYVGPAAADALNMLGWNPKSVSDTVHHLVAKRNGDKLERYWASTKRVLLHDVIIGKYSEITNALFAFISLGKQEIIPELIEILNTRGTKTIAEAYLNCGNKALSDAAEAWVHKHGYTISYSEGSSPVKWGNW